MSYFVQFRLYNSTAPDRGGFATIDDAIRYGQTAQDRTRLGGEARVEFDVLAPSGTLVWVWEMR